MASRFSPLARRLTPALLAALVTATWWSLTIVAPIATADPAGLVQTLARLAAHAGLIASATSS